MPNFFAVCTPGLESFTAKELKDLDLRTTGPSSEHAGSLPAEEDVEEVGGVEFRGSLADLYLANLHLRTASRVLLHLGSFYADTFSDLGRRAKRLSWEAYMRPGRPVALRVTCHKSRLFHSAAVMERILESIGARLGEERDIPGKWWKPDGRRAILTAAILRRNHREEIRYSLPIPVRFQF